MRLRRWMQATGTASRTQAARTEDRGSHSFGAQNQQPTRNHGPSRSRTALHRSVHCKPGCRWQGNNQRGTTPEHDQTRPSQATRRLRRSERNNSRDNQCRKCVEHTESISYNDGTVYSSQQNTTDATSLQVRQ